MGDGCKKVKRSETDDVLFVDDSLSTLSDSQAESRITDKTLH